MIKFEDECVGCPPELGCLGNACSYRNVPHFYCDKCDDEVDYKDLYEYEGKDVCKHCLLELVPKAY